MSEPTTVHFESYKLGKSIETLMEDGLSTLAAIAYAAQEAAERQDKISAQKGEKGE